MEDESLNALLCLDVNEAEVEMISKSIKGFSTGYDLTKCYQLSEKGLSLETLDSKLPKLKDTIIKTYTTFNAMAGGATEDTSTKESTDILFSKLTETQKKVVENMNSEDIFSEFIQTAKSASVEKVDSEIINVEIETFIYYLNL